MPELICFLSVLTTLPGMLSPWKGWAHVLAQRSRSQKLWDCIRGGRGPSPGVGGGRQGEEMSKKPAYRAHVSPGEITEVKQSERRAGISMSSVQVCWMAMTAFQRCSLGDVLRTSTAHSTERECAFITLLNPSASALYCFSKGPRLWLPQSSSQPQKEFERVGTSPSGGTVGEGTEGVRKVGTITLSFSHKWLG